MSHSNEAGDIQNSQGVAIGEGAHTEVTIHNYSTPAPVVEELIFPIHVIAYPENHNFIGRKAILQQVAETLNAGQTTVVTQAISGLGGIGKTQLALAYCYAHLEKYDLIYWLASDNEASLNDSLRGLGQALNLATPVDTDQQATVQRVLRWLSQTKQRWLLVYDNADQLEPKQLSQYMPYTGSGHIIITSRNPNWREVGNVLSLDVFAEEESVAFLRQRRGEATTETFAEKKLAETLGHFPLALEHAAAYMEATGSSPATYQTLFETARDDLWHEIKAPTSYHATITTTWELAFKQIKEIPGALALLNFCCFLAPEEIPLDLIIKYAEALPDELARIIENPITLNSTVAALRRYSMIQRTESTLSIHRLVQTIAQSRMDEALSKKWIKATISWLSLAYIYDEYEMTTWIQSQRLLTHNQIAAEWAVNRAILPEKTVQLLNQTAEYFGRFGDYQTGLAHVKQALDFSEAVLRDDHPDTATSLNNMGGLLQAMGQLAEARPFYEQALAINQKVLGEAHPDTASSLNNMGALLDSMGQLAEARPFYEQALAINQTVLGEAHPHTALSLNNMGALLDSMGQLAEARPFYEQALAIYQRVLGEDHPDTARSLNNMGFLLQAMGLLAEARPFYEQALAIYQRVLGEDHPDTAASLNNMGALLQAMGLLAEARPFYEQALAIYQRVLGDDHPDTAASLNNMGALLQAMGQLAEARPFYEQALAIRQKVLGDDHPDTASSLNNMGFLLQAMGQLAEARPFYEQALAIRQTVLGDDHPDTATSLNNMGGLLLLQGNYVPARNNLERSLKIIERSKGKNHPSLVKILSNLGGALIYLREFTLARRYLRRARAICRDATEPYAECLEAEEYWQMLPIRIGKPKRKKKKRRR